MSMTRSMTSCSNLLRNARLRSSFSHSSAGSGLAWIQRSTVEGSLSLSLPVLVSKGVALLRMSETDQNTCAGGHRGVLAGFRCRDGMNCGRYIRERIGMESYGYLSNIIVLVNWNLLEEFLDCAAEGKEGEGNFCDGGKTGNE